MINLFVISVIGHHQSYNQCTWCKGEAREFRNEISKKEYSISGFCQKCQDELIVRKI